MNDNTLEAIRKYTLWGVLASAAVVLLLELLRVWEVIGKDSPEFIGKLEGTFALILVIGGGVLVSLLVASRVKGADDAAAAKPAPAAKAPAATAAKKPSAKKAPAKKAAAKK